MNALNLSPLFRTAIGFDRMARMLDTASTADVSYPPYNIERTGDDLYRLTMAVAGFGPDDIDITAKDNALLITGRVANVGNGEVLYRGIAGRPFERRFVLADHIVVEGAELANGLLHVALKRAVPEALKPRRIAINGTTPQVLDATPANDGAAAAQAA